MMSQQQTAIIYVLLVSDDAQVDGRVPVFLDGGQQGGAVRVPDLPWVEVVLWIQQLHTHTHTRKGTQITTNLGPCPHV